jgi:enediyne biosynthesis protein E4
MRTFLPILALACAPQPAAHKHTKRPVSTTQPTALPTTVPNTSRTVVWEPLDDIPVGVDAYVGPEVRCEEPGAPALVPHRAGAWGLLGEEDATPSLIVSGGVSVADLDGDGWRDVLLPGASGVTVLTGGADRTWTDRTAVLGLSNVGHNVVSAVPVDTDGDGDLDLFLARELEPNALYIQEDGVFVDRTAGSGLELTDYSVGSAWADYDGDGDLDVAVPTYGNHLIDDSPPSRIYNNQGSNRFVDVSAVLLPGEIRLGHTFLATWIDVDGDMRPELYLTNDFGSRRPSRLFWNVRGALVADLATSGLDVSAFGMGLGIGDLNGDAVPDFLVASINRVLLLVSYPGFWVDSSQAVGLVPDKSLAQKDSWGPLLSDLDNDGDLDAIVPFGHVYVNAENWSEQPDQVYEQADDGTFAPAAWSVPDLNPSRGVIAADLDADGVLDLVKRNHSGPAVLLYGGCVDGSWLEVALEAPGPNGSAIGARIEVTGANRSHTRWVVGSGVSIASSEPTEVHFGLGSDEEVSISVFWPDGATHTLDAVPTRRQLRVVRVADGD